MSPKALPLLRTGVVASQLLVCSLLVSAWAMPDAQAAPSLDVWLENQLARLEENGGCFTQPRASLNPSPPNIARRARFLPRRLAASASVARLDASCITDDCPALEVQRFEDEALYEVDVYGAAHRFYASHPETETRSWDALILFSTFLTTRSGGAVYTPVSNDVRGIARTYLSPLDEVYDHNALLQTGSSGALRGLVLMSEAHSCRFARLANSPCEAAPPWSLDQNGLVGTLLHEVGHRFGAYFQFMDQGLASDALLGRSLAHWSYYADTGGSPLEGNAWERTEAGGFRLVRTSTARFSPLDQYAMGIRPASDVPPALFIENPRPVPCTEDKFDSNAFRGCRTNAATSPARGVNYLTSGEARLVDVRDIIASEGPRTPAFPDAPQTMRLGWALLELPEAQATTEELETLDALRHAFTRAFYEATGRRMRPLTRLDGRDDLGVFDFTLNAEGWHLNGGIVEFRDGLAHLLLSGTQPSFAHDALALDASSSGHLALRLAFEGAVVGATLRWTGRVRGEHSTHELALPVVADGIARTLTIPVHEAEGWDGVIESLALDFQTDGPGSVSLDFLEFADAPLHPDSDGDWFVDADDNCPQHPNPTQADRDGLGYGDACPPRVSGGCTCQSTQTGFVASCVLGLFLKRRRSRGEASRS